MGGQIWARVFSQDSRLLHAHNKLWLFPLAAGSAWFTTLSILLLRWLALGRPRYPGQVNPEVPFVSDIAAFTLQPVFVAGCAATGVSFAGTVFAVHHVRYSDRFYGLLEDDDDDDDDAAAGSYSWWRQAASFGALFAGLVAAACLVLLSVFDTFENNDEHRYLLMSTFGGLALSALLTTAVWWDQIWGPAKFPGLRKWCLFNTFLVACQTAIGIAFVTFMYTGQFRQSGYLEWTLSYVGSFWMASFVGYTRFRESGVCKSQVDDEQRPLLSA